MNSMKNNISVIMSVYNDEKNVESAIESILNQSYKNFEFLIVDDCSIDSTFEKIEKFQNLDSRVKIFKNSKNIGLTKSLNLLLKKSTTELIARQDSDDFSLPTRLEEQVNFIKDKKYDAVYTRAINKQTKTKIPGLSFYLPHKISIKYKNPYIHGSLLIKHKVLRSLNYYSENFYYAQDYKLAWDLHKKNYKVGVKNKVLYILNTKNNISDNFRNEQKHYADCVRKELDPS